MKELVNLCGFYTSLHRGYRVFQNYAVPYKGNSGQIFDRLFNEVDLPLKKRDFAPAPRCAEIRHDYWDLLELFRAKALLA